MIELAFGESAAGGLKMAKSTMESSPGDVAALTLALDMGDISDMDTGMNARKQFLDHLFVNFPGASDAIWQTNLHTLSRLEEAKASQEPVRMWICTGNPAELCGFYFVCRLLAEARTPLSVVRIPEQIEKANGIVSYRHTGEIIPELLGAFTAYEQPVSDLQRLVYANAWKELARENAPLRAVVNGSLMSVPEDFYDFALRANLPDGEFKVAQLIGNVLGQIPGVGDRWLFLRLQAMLEAEELTLVSPAMEDHPYSEVVKRKN